MESVGILGGLEELNRRIKAFKVDQPEMMLPKLIDRSASQEIRAKFRLEKREEWVSNLFRGIRAAHQQPKKKEALAAMKGSVPFNPTKNGGTGVGKISYSENGFGPTKPEEVCDAPPPPVDDPPPKL